MSELNNGDMPVNPIVMDNGHPYHASNVCFENTPLASGLTKREHFAGLAMINIISRYNPWEEGDFDSSEYEIVAENAVGLADALLKQLDK